MERNNKFVNMIKRKKVGQLPKRKMVQNEWIKLKWKAMQIERDRGVYILPSHWRHLLNSSEL